MIKKNQLGSYLEWKVFKESISGTDKTTYSLTFKNAQLDRNLCFNSSSGPGSSLPAAPKRTFLSEVIGNCPAHGKKTLSEILYLYKVSYFSALNYLLRLRCC